MALFPIRSLFAIASALVVAVVVVSAATSGSYALLSDTEQVNAGVISTGSLTLVADPDGEFDSTLWDDMLPGDRRSQPLELHNDGTVRSDVSVAITADPNMVTVAVIGGGCPADGIPPSGDTIELGLWDADETATVCVEVIMSLLAPEPALTDDGLSFQLLFTAKQHIA